MKRYKGNREKLSIITVMQSFLFRDVRNEDESSKPAIELRLAALGMLGYFLFMAAGIFWSRDCKMLEFTVPYFLLYGAVFAFTYYEQVRIAAYGLNLLTIFYIVAGIYYFGWNLGIQHFLFVLILVDFFLPYWRLSIKLVFAGAVCVLRIGLFYYCRQWEPRIVIPEDIIFYYQIVNTVCIFIMISIYGCLVSSNFLAMEKKLIETNKKLRHQAGTDPLTQLMNRLHLMEYAAVQMKRTDCEKGISVAIGDIDHFKVFNDTYGHACGDAVLKTLAELFKRVMQPYGVAARWGGEEFLFLFPESNGDEAFLILSDLQDKIRRMEVEYHDLRLNVTMTFGLAEIDRMGSFDESIREADQLLYTGKENGRDQIVY